MSEWKDYTMWLGRKLEAYKPCVRVYHEFYRTTAWQWIVSCMVISLPSPIHRQYTKSLARSRFKHCFGANSFRPQLLTICDLWGGTPPGLNGVYFFIEVLAKQDRNIQTTLWSDLTRLHPFCPRCVWFQCFFWSTAHWSCWKDQTTSGALVGYVDLGDINGYLCDYEQQITQGSVV